MGYTRAYLWYAIQQRLELNEENTREEKREKKEQFQSREKQEHNGRDIYTKMQIEYGDQLSPVLFTTQSFTYIRKLNHFLCMLLLCSAKFKTVCRCRYYSVVVL